MPMYLARVKLSKEFMNAVVDRPEDRITTTTKLLKGIGGRLHNYFFAFGEYDIILLFDLPDNVSAASLSMVLSASSSATEIEITPLLTMQEAVEAMHRSSEAMAVYKPPTGSKPPAGPKRTRKRKAK